MVLIIISVVWLTVAVLALAACRAAARGDRVGGVRESAATAQERSGRRPPARPRALRRGASLRPFGQG